jgi:hypothetical protein
MAGWGDFKAKPDVEYKSKVEKKVTEIFLDVVTEDSIEPYTPQIRASSLPICILLHSHALLQPHVRVNEARLAQYSAIGTALHELYQDQYLRHPKWGRFVYGSFTCRNRQCETVLETNTVRPDDWASRKCPKCGTEGLKYKEVEAKYKGTLGIHVDMLLKFKGDRFWLIDWKTTSSFKISDPNFKPKNKHIAQISSYPIVLKEELGINVERFFLGYVNRDGPQHSKTSKRQSRWFPFKTDTTLMQLKKIQLNNLIIGERARKHYFNNPTKANLKTLDDLRPCRSNEDYQAPILGMKTAFEDSQKCPYANTKGCFKDGISKAAKELDKMIKEQKQ